MTLKEFITKINANEHYRIYQPNRDCLIFESYFKVHSPYKFDNEDYEFNNNYYSNNEYCDDVYNRVIDKETKTFLKRFGKYIIVHLECSTFKPCNMSLVDDNVCTTDVRDKSRPYSDVLPCFNVFIVPRK